MSFAERAVLLGTLGGLKLKGALKDTQFDTLKERILRDDDTISDTILANVGSFWSLRCEGTLTDTEYQGQIKDVLRGSDGEQVLENESSPSASAAARQAKRVRRDSGEGASGGPACAGGSSAAGAGRRSSSAKAPAGGGAGKKTSKRPAKGDKTDEGDKDEEPESTDEADDDDDDDDGSTSDIDPDNKSSSDEEDVISGPRWKRTDDVEIPGKGFCKDPSARWIVDSTVKLLEKSTERTFPGLLPCHGYEVNCTQRHKRQRVMYRMWRKVLICEDDNGERTVYRATGDEVKEAVPDVSTGRLSNDEYLKAVMKRCAVGPALSEL